MLKRVYSIGLAVGLGLAALQGGPAEAQDFWEFLAPPGMWWYYGSLDGCATILKVPSPTQHPAQLVCEVQVSEVQGLCKNPAGNEVQPGKAATKVTIFATQKLTEQNLTKTKGKGANVCVEITDGCPSGLCSDQFCVNPNWQMIDVITTQFLATCTTHECTGTDPTNPCAQSVPTTHTQRCLCTLPPGFGVLNKPTPCSDPLHPDASCTAYQCDEVDADGIPTGAQCELQ